MRLEPFDGGFFEFVNVGIIIGIFITIFILALIVVIFSIAANDGAITISQTFFIAIIASVFITVLAFICYIGYYQNVKHELYTTNDGHTKVTHIDKNVKNSNNNDESDQRIYVNTNIGECYITVPRSFKINEQNNVLIRSTTDYIRIDKNNEIDTSTATIGKLNK